MNYCINASERLFLNNPTMAGGCVAIRQPSWGASGCSKAWSETMSLAFRHCDSVTVQRHGLRPSFLLRISPHESRFQLSLPCYRGVNEKQLLRGKTFEARHRSVRLNFSYKQIRHGLGTKGHVFRQQAVPLYKTVSLDTEKDIKKVIKRHKKRDSLLSPFLSKWRLPTLPLAQYHRRNEV